MRLVFITVAIYFLALKLGDWVRAHLGLMASVSAATIGVIDEYVMRLLPATIEPGAPGGLGVS